MHTSHQQKTKIVATVGPASSSEELIRSMIQEGASAFRLNFSHGTHETHAEIISRIRSMNEELGTHACILQDLQGPKIRLQSIANGQIHVRSGQEICITTQQVEGNEKVIGTNYKQLPQDVHIGQTILISDGKIELKINKIEENLVRTTVVHGGVIKSLQGLNLPDTSTSLSALTEKDKADLDFGLKHEVEWVALSFVRQASDVSALKEIIHNKGYATKVIAKIEKPEALTHIADIIEVSDGIMVARGDLGVEIPTELVPIAQKRIVKACNKSAKPVIIATHMMESMIENSRPTRAEATDVANAVIDGADAVMLSAETATGLHPILAIRTMRRIIHLVEQEISDIYEKKHDLNIHSPRLISDRLIRAACELRKSLEARAIVSLTESGYSGFRISSFRPETDILIFSSKKQTIQSLSLVWGVRAFYYDRKQSTDQTVIDIEHFLRKEGIFKEKDTFVILTSMPINAAKTTNTIKVHVVKDPPLK